MRPAAVLFDAGLTLIHADGQVLLDEMAADGLPGSRWLTAADATRALVLAAEARHLPLPRGADGDTKVATALATYLGLSGPRALAACLRALARPDLYTLVDPGSSACLRDLRRLGVKTGVVSNSGGTLRDDLAAHGLLGDLDIIVDSTVAGVEKPAARIFGLALRELGLTGPDAWFVGDGLVNDVLGALSAGFAASILYDPFRCYEHLPHITRIASLAEVPARVKGGS